MMIWLIILIFHVLNSSKVASKLIVSSIVEDDVVRNAVGTYEEILSNEGKSVYQLTNTNGRYLYQTEKGIWSVTSSLNNIQRNKGTIVSDKAYTSPHECLKWKYYSKEKKWIELTQKDFSIIKTLPNIEKESKEELEACVVIDSTNYTSLLLSVQFFLLLAVVFLFGLYLGKQKQIAVSTLICDESMDLLVPDQRDDSIGEASKLPEIALPSSARPLSVSVEQVSTVEKQKDNDDDDDDDDDEKDTLTEKEEDSDDVDDSAYRRYEDDVKLIIQNDDGSNHYTDNTSKIKTLQKLFGEVNDLQEFEEEEEEKEEEDSPVFETKLDDQEDKSDQLNEIGLVIKELVDSETRYSKYLEIIEKLKLKLCPLTKDHAVLFQGSSELLRLSQNFLHSLTQQISNHHFNDAKLGSILNLFIPHFKVYTVYSDTFDVKQATLCRLLEGSSSTMPSTFASCVHEVLAEEETHQDLQSLLIKPIQRLPHYKLLFERLLSAQSHLHQGGVLPSSVEDDEEEEMLRKAVLNIGIVAEHINKSLERQENQFKILKLQTKFIPKTVFVSPGRVLIKQGELNKISETNGQRQRYTFFLFNDSLVYGSKLLRGYYRFRRFLTVTGIHDDDEIQDKSKRKPPTYFRRVSDPWGESEETEQAEALLGGSLFPNLAAAWNEYDLNENKTLSLYDNEKKDNGDKSNLFSLISKEKNFTLEASSYEEKQAWVIAIADSIHGRHQRQNSFACF